MTLPDTVPHARKFVLRLPDLTTLVPDLAERRAVLHVR